LHLFTNVWENKGAIRNSRTCSVGSIE
jgi:hypothetical protein